MKRALFACATLLACVAPVWAADPTEGALSHRILPGWIDGDGTRMAGLELTLAPGWKTYWRSPGDAGIPPAFDWRGARNLDGVEVYWPTPKVFWQSGMRSVGYENRVVLPLKIAPNRAGRDIRLRGDVSLGICSDICIPAQISVDAVLPAEANTRTPAIAAAMASVPYTESEAGVTSASCDLRPTSDGLIVTARVDMPTAGGSEQAVIETHDPAVWVSDPETTRQGGQLQITAEMMHSTETTLMVDRSRIRITVIGGRYAVDIQGCAD